MTMTHALVLWIVLGFACVPLLYYVFALDTARRFLATSASAGDRDFTPPISVLKPVRGLDRNAFEQFSSFCRQDYPHYEILFAVADRDDPAIPVIRQVIETYPNRSIRLIVGVAEVGPSSKVNKLCRLVREARHDVLVVSDSDITAPPGYLRAVAAPFRDEHVGGVTCLYRGASDGGLSSDLEGLGISTDFAPGVLVARRLEGVRFMLGATMATTRAVLREIGGFEALADYCADDYEIGHRIAALGRRIEFAACTVSTASAAASVADFCRHELRWAITLRHARPWGYVGRFIGTQGLPWTLAAAVLAPWPAVAGAYAAAYVVLRLSLAWTVGWKGLGDEIVRRRLWLVPVRDGLSFLVSLAAFCSNTIDWRGRSYELRRGKLIPIGAAGREPDGTEQYLRP